MATGGATKVAGQERSRELGHRNRGGELVYVHHSNFS